MDLAINQKQKVKVVGTKDGSDEQAATENPNVASSDTSKLLVEVNADAEVRLIPQPGASVGDEVTVSFSADVRVGPGVRILSGSITVRITTEVTPPGESTGVTLVADGDPEFIDLTPAA